MTPLTATDARKSFFEILKSTKEQHEIYQIRHKCGDAVLMSKEEYEGLSETLELLSTPGFKDDFEKACAEAESGDLLTFEEFFGEPQ
jgi:antitoxin YefM